MWHKCGSVWAPTRAPNEFQAFFMNTENDQLEASIPAGQWVKCKLPGLPPGVKFCHAVFSGILIITGYPPAGAVQVLDTGGVARYVSEPMQAQAIIDVTCAFKAVGEAWDYGYVMQACEAHKGGGQRSNVLSGCPLNDAGEFMVKWTKAPAGILPNWSQGAPAEALNLFAMELREKL